MFFDFPQQDVVKELKEKNWLKPGSMMEIAKGLWSDDYRVSLRENFAKRYYFIIFFSIVMAYYVVTPLLRHYKIIMPDNGYTFIVYILSLLILMICSFLDLKKTSKGLGCLIMPAVFVEFLDKFGRGKSVKFAETPDKILFLVTRIFKKRKFDRKWWIEYDILVKAFEWCQRDPQDFQKEFRKAKNKKELRWILGVS